MLPEQLLERATIPPRDPREELELGLPHRRHLSPVPSPGETGETDRTRETGTNPVRGT